MYNVRDGRTFNVLFINMAIVNLKTFIFSIFFPFLFCLCAESNTNALIILIRQRLLSKTYVVDV